MLLLLLFFVIILFSDDLLGKEEKLLKYVDHEKYDYIQNYLEQSREQTKEADSHSVTTETSDSGMLGSNSASSEVGTEDTNGKLKPGGGVGFGSYFPYILLNEIQTMFS